LRYVSRQTDRQTDILVTILCTPPRGKVIIRTGSLVHWLLDVLDAAFSTAEGTEWVKIQLLKTYSIRNF